MKKLILVFLLISFFIGGPIIVKAQQNVGIGTTTPNNSAILDLTSNDRGILIPRMTTAQRLAISLPATGLLVYDSSLNQFWYYNGTLWVQAIGPVGPTGPQGVIGITGPSGQDGIAGVPGTTGPIGPTGSQGNPGLPGAVGPTGDQGNPGLPGSVGPIGPTGNQGIPGIVGATGPIGPTGNQGIPGTVGATGPSGPTGADGALNAWALLGNAATVDGTNFLGTTDNIPLNFRINNQKAGRITSAGQVLLGYQAGNVNTGTNIGLGYQSLFSTSTGNYNTAIGYQAQYLGTTGNDDNVAIGRNAMHGNVAFSNSDYNVALGYQSLYYINGGYDNVAIGQNALYRNTTGNNNIAIGYWALQGDADGIQNTGIGQYTLYQNQGNYNTACGYAAGAGASSPTYTYCTFLGYDADAAASGTYTNGMALGYNTDFQTSNYIGIGNTSITDIRGNVGFGVYSDGRVKDNVMEDVMGLDFIMKLRPVTYHLNKNKEDALLGKTDASDYPEKYDIEKIKFSGFIAQEVEQAALSIGYDFSGVKKPKGSTGLYGLCYSDFVVPLVKATQEQQRLIEEQRDTLIMQGESIKQLEQTIETLQKQNLEILGRINTLEGH